MITTTMLRVLFALQFFVLTGVTGFSPISTITNNMIQRNLVVRSRVSMKSSYSHGNKSYHGTTHLNAAATNDSTPSSSSNTKYDVIVVGSGNGACALLSECLANAPQNQDYNILVLEQGQSYFSTSDYTHQNGWSKSYATSNIFKLHNAMTSDGKPVIAGRACTQGGGGSINFTMIHESSTWLAKHLGKTEDYWDQMKAEFSEKLKLDNPFHAPESFPKVIKEKATKIDNPFKLPNEKDNYAGNVPSLNEKELKQLYIFPTQFNDFGQRVKSGVSLIDWEDERIHLKCLCEVESLNFAEGGTCESVHVRNNDKNKNEIYSVKPGGKVILCGGSASPRLLMKCKELKNEHIGKYVKDHICMPLGVYIVAKKKDDDMADLIGPKNNYESIFAMASVPTGNGDEREIANFDFFSGKFDRLVFLVSSLYLAFLPFNFLKRLMGRFPILFTILSNSLRVLLMAVTFILSVLYGLKDFLTFQGWGATEIKITTSLVKFNNFADGHYEKKGDKIILKFFEDERDFVVAEEAIKDNLALLDSLGSKLPLLFRIIFRFITKIPYETHQVRRYVKHFSRKTLLSEQHLAGGCLFGKVIDLGDKDPLDTGKVFDTTNLYVADLSCVPLPRVSTQMTAYLVGHYVGKQLFSPTAIDENTVVVGTEDSVN